MTLFKIPYADTANSPLPGIVGVQQDQAKAMELYARATELGLIKANRLLADIYHKGGDLKKARAAAMAGHEVSRNNLGILEAEYGTIDRAIKHCQLLHQVENTMLCNI